MRVTRSRSSAKRAGTTESSTLTSPLTPKTRTSLKARNSSPQTKINSDPELPESKTKNETDIISNQDEQEFQPKSALNVIRRRELDSTTAETSSTRKSKEIGQAASSTSDQRNDAPGSPVCFYDGITISGVSSQLPAMVEEKSANDVDAVDNVGTGNNGQSEGANPTGAGQNTENTKDDVNARVAAREKYRASNDHLVRKLFHSLPANCKKAENAALDFIVEEIHHPVISCFRELMNFNDLAAIFRLNGKKRLRSFEFGLVGVGMLDSIAMTLHNPLYQESFDCLWNRKISQKVEKILQKLKPLLTHWGTSEKLPDREQYDNVMKYLQRLTPQFQPINFSESYESTLTKIIGDVEQTVLSRQDLRLKTQSFFNAGTITEPESSTASTLTPSSSKSLSNTSTVSIESTMSIPTSDEENEWKMTSTSIPSSSESSSPQKRKRPKILIPSSLRNTEDGEVIVVDLASKFAEKEEPPYKIPKLELTSSCSSLSDQPKPKVNAFALMMNRSRQLAEMAKLKQDKSRQTVNQLATSKGKSGGIVT